MKILTAILTTVATIATVQPASATIQEAHQLAQYAWDAIAVREWKTASMFLQQAIEANPNVCMDGWYEQQVQEVYEDCVE